MRSFLRGHRILSASLKAQEKTKRTAKTHLLIFSKSLNIQHDDLHFLVGETALDATQRWLRERAKFFVRNLQLKKLFLCKFVFEFEKIFCSVY